LTWIPLAGLAVGILYGTFGVGSAFATPVLSLMGVGGLAAVAAPLPGLLPSSAAGAWSYTRRDKVDWRLARRVVLAAVPASILGSFASRWIGGPALLVASGIVLAVIGVRVLRPATDAVDLERARARRERATFVVAAATVIGAASGLMANGGGFLLVPLFLLALGLDINEAAGTSMVCAAALTIPTLLTHALLGDIDWAVSGVFALGLIPGACLGGAAAQRVPADRLRPAFGVVLVVFAAWFTLHQLA
jgi:uncharacterized membrane protein YfcA